MKFPRFQFTVKRALAATFWMAVCFGVDAAGRSIGPQWEFRGPDFLWQSINVSVFYITGLSPFIAVGVWFSRAVGGAIVGFAFTSLIIAASSLDSLRFAQTPDETQSRIRWIAWGLLGVVLAIGVLIQRRIVAARPPQS